MPFDGIDYGDAALIPKVSTHPDAALVGVTYGQGLRNSYFRERRHGRGGPTIAPPVDYERAPPSDRGFEVRFASRAAPVSIFDVGRWVPGHYTHAFAHVVFQAVEAEGGLSSWQLRAGAGPAGIADVGDAVEVPFSPEAPSRVPAVAPLPGDTDQLLYEAICFVEFSATTLDQLVHLQLWAGADEEDENGTRTAVAFRPLSFSFWCESVG